MVMIEKGSRAWQQSWSLEKLQWSFERLQLSLEKLLWSLEHLQLSLGSKSLGPFRLWQ